MHTHATKCYSTIKKKDIMPFATTQIGLKDIMLSKMSGR